MSEHSSELIFKKIILFNPAATDNLEAPHEPSVALPMTTSQDFIKRANTAFHEGNLPQAREALRAALAFHPDDAELILALGHVEFGLEHYELAASRYALVAEMTPSRAEAHSSQALTLKLLGRNQEAETAAHRALCIHNEDVVAMKVLARISLDAKRQESTRHWSRAILNLNPQDAEGLQFLDQCHFEWDELMITPEEAKHQNKPASHFPIPGHSTPADLLSHDCRLASGEIL